MKKTHVIKHVPVFTFKQSHLLESGQTGTDFKKIMSLFTRLRLALEVIMGHRDIIIFTLLIRVNVITFI